MREGFWEAPPKMTLNSLNRRKLTASLLGKRFPSREAPWEAPFHASMGSSTRRLSTHVPSTISNPRVFASSLTPSCRIFKAATRLRFDLWVLRHGLNECLPPPASPCCQHLVRFRRSAVVMPAVFPIHLCEPPTLNCDAVIQQAGFADLRRPSKR
jgi:hypothetical protein